MFIDGKLLKKSQHASTENINNRGSKIFVKVIVLNNQSWMNT